MSSLALTPPYLGLPRRTEHFRTLPFVSYAPVSSQVVASSAIPPMRKDVLAKCYGGDITRKKKLLQKQAKGKKRMKSMGKVNVPQEAFMAVLDLSNE